MTTRPTHLLSTFLTKIIECDVLKGRRVNELNGKVSHVEDHLTLIQDYSITCYFTRIYFTRIGCENMKWLLEAVGKNVHKISDK